MTLATAYIQEGVTIDYPNSSGSSISYLEIIPLTDNIVIAAETIANGSTGSVYTEGVFELPAVNNDSFAIGDRLYWDARAGELTQTATANTNAGYCVEAKGTTTTTALVKLQPQTKEGDSAAIALIGDLDDLNTTEKGTIVGAINEVLALVQAIST